MDINISKLLSIMTDFQNIVITKETIKRLVKDIKEIRDNPLIDNGIFYEHSEDDMLKGQALIIGPPDTPYYHGYFFFKFDFPRDYPHRPPTVTYCTNDGITRFNPNLYKCGKVCISLLNTWKGPQWTGCQTISTILFSLCSAVLNDTPLLNEPGITKKHADYYNYNEIITFKKYDVAIASMLHGPSNIKNNFPVLYKIMVENYINEYKNIIKELKKDIIKTTTISTSIYRMNIHIDYSNMEQKLSYLYKTLKKLK